MSQFTWETLKYHWDYLIYIGPCIIVIVENKRPTWCHLLFLFHFLCAQHVSDINISIIRSLRLFCWVTTLVVCSWFDVCWCFSVVGLEWYPCCRLQPAMSETCWAHKKWNKNSKWHQVDLLFSTVIGVTVYEGTMITKTTLLKDIFMAAFRAKHHP